MSAEDARDQRGRGLGRDALVGLLLALLVVVTVLFSTGVDSSFIYIDF